MTTRGEINSNFYQIVNVDANGAPTSVKPEYLPNVGNANYAANAGHANIADTANLVAVANVSGIGNIATINLSGNGSQVLLGNGTWGAGGGGNATNANYANFAGNVVGSSQPNITSVGTLSNLTLTGNINTPTAVYSDGAIAPTPGSYVGLFDSTFSNGYYVDDATVQVTKNANTWTFGGDGNLTLPSNTASINYANGSPYGGSSNVANANYANFAGTAFSVSGSNVTGIVGNATHANFADVANLVAGANVTGIVGNATHANYADVANLVAGANVTGNVGNSVHAYFADVANSVSGSNVTGNVGNSVHAYFADVANSVSGSNVTGNVGNSVHAYFADVANSVAGANVTGVVGNATHATIADSANSVAGANVTGQVANALVAGTVYTNAQPNITSVGTLTDLTVTGNIQSYADISGAYIYGNGAFLTGVGNLSASNGYWGSFYSNVTQTIASTTTAYAITLNNTDPDSHGVSISSNSHINFTYAGTYNLQFSAQFDNGSLTSEDASVWLRKNGVDVIDSRGQVSVPSSHGGLNGQIIESWNYVLKLAAGDYLELYWQAESTSVSMAYLGAGTTPTTPASPSIIVTAMQVTNVQPVELQGAMTGNIVGNGYSLLNIASISSLDGITGNTFTGNGAPLTNLTGANVVGNVGNAVHAYFADVANSVSGSNVSGQVGNALIAGTVYTNAQPNITSVGTLTSLSSSGNITAPRFISNIATGNAPFVVSSTTPVNNLRVGGQQPNITALNNSGVTVYNSSTVSATARYLLLTGSQNIDDNLQTAAGITANAANSSITATTFVGALSGTATSATTATTAGTVTTNAQPNITSVGTLTSLSVTGTITGNTTSTSSIYVSQANNISISNRAANTTQFNLVITGSTGGASNIGTGSTTTNNPLFVDPVLTLKYQPSTGNLTATRFVGNVTGTLTGAADTAGTVTTNAQPNITSVGTLTSLAVTGNISANYYTGNGSLLTGITSTNSNYANFAGNVVNSSQPNITSLGTLTSLNVSGNIFSNTAVYIGNTSNATGLTNPTLVAKASGATYVQGALINGSTNGSADWVAYGDNGSDSGAWADMGFTGSNFSDPLYTLTGINDGYFIVQGDDSSAYGGNLVIATGQQGSTKDIVFGTGGFLAANEKMRFIHSAGQFYIQPTTAATDTTTGALRVAGGVGIGGDVYAGNVVSANYFVGNGSLLTGITATNANYANYAGNAFSVDAGNIVGTINLANYATVANNVAVANVSGIGNIAVVNLDGNLSNILYGNGVFAAAPSVSNVANANYANFAGTAFSVAGANVTGVVGNATHATVADSANSVAGINVTGTVANATYALTAGSATTAATVTTASQPNITSVGTLSSLSVTGNITSGNINGGNLVTGNYFTGNGSLLTSITAANINGTVANATYAISADTSNTSITVTGGSQPNITSVGTLASLTATGNITGNYFIGNGSALTGITATATPGGANTNLQFNNAGSMGGISTVTWNGSNLSLGAIGNVKITGGSSGQVISTDGTGNLSFVAQSGGGGSSGFENIFLMMGA